MNFRDIAAEVVIVSAVRTPIGSFGGVLSSLRADELGTIVIKEALRRVGLVPEKLPAASEVIMGQVLCAGQGQNPARQSALCAGLPFTVPAYTLNMVCGSGIRAVVNGYLGIKNGDLQLAVCGGQESMSQTPHIVQLRTGLKMADASLRDTILCDGLMCAFHNVHMGETAEKIAEIEGITRQQQDEFALESQHRVEKAQKAGHFNNEIVPVKIDTPEGITVVTADEHPRKNLKMADLQRLIPAFKKDGTVTAGNASGINDGASVLILMDESIALGRSIKPLAKIVGWTQSGVDPKIMGTGSISAVKSLLEKIRWRVSDVDLFELSEAYSCQVIAVLKQLGLDPAKVNINGGGIALGHPLGASGACILVTLIHSLQRTKRKRGVASICIGGGMGIAIAVEIY